MRVLVIVAVLMIVAVLRSMLVGVPASNQAEGGGGDTNQHVVSKSHRLLSYQFTLRLQEI